MSSQLVMHFMLRRRDRVLCVLVVSIHLVVVLLSPLCFPDLHLRFGLVAHTRVSPVSDSAACLYHCITLHHCIIVTLICIAYRTSKIQLRVSRLSNICQLYVSQLTVETSLGSCRKNLEHQHKKFFITASARVQYERLIT